MNTYKIISVEVQSKKIGANRVYEDVIKLDGKLYRFEASGYLYTASESVNRHGDLDVMYNATHRLFKVGENEYIYKMGLAKTKTAKLYERKNDDMIIDKCGTYFHSDCVKGGVFEGVFANIK